MARAETPTQLPLDSWFSIMGVHPLHASGVIQPSDDPGPSSLCSGPWPQYPWQATDRMGRDDLAIAISEAEAQIEEVLGYHLTPQWTYDEWKNTVRANRPELVVTNNFDVRGHRRVVFPNWSYFISGGIEAATKLSAANAVTYTDEDADGYAERATMTFVVPTTTIFDPDELEIHLPDSSEAGEYSEKNNIRPIQVNRVDNGNGTYTFTIRCRREQLVLWDKATTLPPFVGVNGSDAAVFASTVEIWRHYNDPRTQATMMWEYGGCGCGTSGCATCQYTVQTGCLNLRSDGRMPAVTYSPSEWDETEQGFSSRDLVVCRDPDIVRLFYRSGLRANTPPIGPRFDMQVNKMDRHWGRIVAAFAASKLERPNCDCEARLIDYWAQDLAYVSGAEQLTTFNFSLSDIAGSMFGTRRGAVNAWKACQSPAVGRVALV